VTLRPSPGLPPGNWLPAVARPRRGNGCVYKRRRCVRHLGCLPGNGFRSRASSPSELAVSAGASVAVDGAGRCALSSWCGPVTLAGVAAGAGGDEVGAVVGATAGFGDDVVDAGSGSAAVVARRAGAQDGGADLAPGVAVSAGGGVARWPAGWRGHSKHPQHSSCSPSSGWRSAKGQTSSQHPQWW